MKFMLVHHKNLKKQLEVSGKFYLFVLEVPSEARDFFTLLRKFKQINTSTCFHVILIKFVSGIRIENERSV